MKYGTVLVIDDNPAILTAVKICLTGVFERVVTLNSPEKALVTIVQENPAAILLDMNFSLGVNSGQEGMMWLSVIHRKFPDIPIVLITAYADVKLAVRALKNGAADLLGISRQTLYNKVKASPLTPLRGGGQAFFFQRRTRHPPRCSAGDFHPLLYHQADGNRHWPLPFPPDSDEARYDNKPRRESPTRL